MLTKTECLYIATKFNDEARAKLVLRWQQLELAEQERRQQLALPSPKKMSSYNFNAVLRDMGIQYRRHGRWNICEELEGRGLTVTIEDALGVPLLIADNGDKTAVLDGSSNGELNIQSDVQVEEVVVDREFNKGQPSTLMLPFAIDVADDNGPEFYTFSGIAFDDVEHKWTASMTQVEPGNSIAANTPCIVVPNGERLGLFGSQTLNTKTGGSKQTTQGDWAFKGTYTEKTWTADECGNDYGFAATSGTATDGVTDVEAGDFVQIAEGAHIRPMRSYITYTGTTNPWAGAPRHAAANLPQRISVVLKKADGSTTEIGAIENGELKIDNWYTLDGHKLNKKPAKKGMYIHNGYKAIVK